MTPLEAATALATRHGLRYRDAIVLKDGSNLSVHMAPTPVMIRVATFTARIRREPLAWLEREVDLVSWLSSAGAAVMAPSEVLPVGPHVIGGWALTAWEFVEHRSRVVPDAATTFAALDDLHEALRGYPGELPLLNPAADDLDRAIAFGIRHRLIGPSHADDLRARRDAAFGDLVAAAPNHQALHGDAFPRNSLVTEHGIVWIDFEDCCSGPRAWDHATLLRRSDDAALEASIRARDIDGDAAIDAALVLRAVQEEVWNILHDARLDGRLPDADP
jgi:hypothetical protein